MGIKEGQALPTSVPGAVIAIHYRQGKGQICPPAYSKLLQLGL